MRRITLLLLCAIPLLLPAQNIEGRLKHLNEHNGTYAALLSETRTIKKGKQQSETVRKGHLYYRMPDDTALRFDNGDYSIFLDGKCYGRETGKTQRYAVSEKNKTRHYRLRQLWSCALRGDVKAAAKDLDGKLQSKESTTRFLFTITRKADQGLVSAQLVYDKVEGTLLIVKLIEANGDLTAYELSDGVPRQVLPEDAFAM